MPLWQVCNSIVIQTSLCGMLVLLDWARKYFSTCNLPRSVKCVWTWPSVNALVCSTSHQCTGCALCMWIFRSMHRGWIHTLNCFVCVSVCAVAVHSQLQEVCVIWLSKLRGLISLFLLCCFLLPSSLFLTHTFFHSFFSLCSLPVCVCLHQPASLLLYCSSPFCSSPWVARCQR